VLCHAPPTTHAEVDPVEGDARGLERRELRVVDHLDWAVEAERGRVAREQNRPLRARDGREDAERARGARLLCVDELRERGSEVERCARRRRRKVIIEFILAQRLAPVMPT
jgi:hypothetical protein